MNEVLIIFGSKYNDIKNQNFSIDEFYKYFNVINEIVTGKTDWHTFLTNANLPLNYIPNYDKSGFIVEQLEDLERLGYIQGTECYSLDCYSINGNIFASQFEDQINSGEHITQSWQLLIAFIENQENCKIYFK